MSKIERSDYLALHGKTLIDNGYNIIPIPPKSKGPGFDGWQKTKATKSLLGEWINDGMGAYGIGILTKYTVAVDLDIRDAGIVKKIVDYIEMALGEAPIRVGNAPKTLLLFGADEPFRKMKTGKYVDEWGMTMRSKCWQTVSNSSPSVSTKTRVAHTNGQLTRHR